jgi:hypothetical protein
VAAITHQDRAKYLKCVLYERSVLACAIRDLRSAENDEDAEVAKTAGALKLRTLYDFMHRPQACDTIKRSMFNVYNPVAPPHMDPAWEQWLTLQSINTYFTHLDRRRIQKTVPQPKFQRGKDAVIGRGIVLLQQARTLAQSVIDHEDFVGLDRYGNKYWDKFTTVLDELQN